MCRSHTAYVPVCDRRIGTTLGGVYDFEKVHFRLRSLCERFVTQMYTCDLYLAKENAPPPKVFSLVGKSAAEVGAMASQVSQVTTSVEERVALNKLQHAVL